LTAYKQGKNCIDHVLVRPKVEKAGVAIEYKDDPDECYTDDTPIQIPIDFTLQNEIPFRRGPKSEVDEENTRLYIAQE
jgi:hypothetical protein